MGLSDEELRRLASDMLAIKLLCTRDNCKDEVVPGEPYCLDHLPRGECGQCGEKAEIADYLCHECRLANDLADSL